MAACLGTEFHGSKPGGEDGDGRHKSKGEKRSEMRYHQRNHERAGARSRRLAMSTKSVSVKFAAALVFCAAVLATPSFAQTSMGRISGTDTRATRTVACDSNGHFRLAERINLRLQGDFYNAPNTANFSGLNTTITSSAYGTMASAYPPRQIQLALKLAF
jgi:hypothetical protein